MTSATARANAAAKLAEQQRREELLEKWREMLADGVQLDEFLKVGGTPADLQWFLYTHT